MRKRFEVLELFSQEFWHSHPLEEARGTRGRWQEDKTVCEIENLIRMKKKKEEEERRRKKVDLESFEVRCFQHLVAFHYFLRVKILRDAVHQACTTQSGKKWFKRWLFGTLNLEVFFSLSSSSLFLELERERESFMNKPLISLHRLNLCSILSKMLAKCIGRKEVLEPCSSLLNASTFFPFNHCHLSRLTSPKSSYIQRFHSISPEKWKRRWHGRRPTIRIRSQSTSGSSHVSSPLSILTSELCYLIHSHFIFKMRCSKYLWIEQGN